MQGKLLAASIKQIEGIHTASGARGCVFHNDGIRTHTLLGGVDDSEVTVIKSISKTAGRFRGEGALA